jgi:hypothetical protein
VEDDVLGLDFPVLDVHLVPTQDYGYVVADSNQVSVPVGNVLVRNASRHVKHDDGTLALDVVAVAESPKLLLTCRVPHVEPDRTSVGVENQRMNLHTQGCDILLLELARQVSLDERGLPSTAVPHQNQLEGSYWLCRRHSLGLSIELELAAPSDNNDRSPQFKLVSGGFGLNHCACVMRDNPCVTYYRASCTSFFMIAMLCDL